MLETLIKLVRKNPSLYNASHPEYKNIFAKNEIWFKIAEELCTDAETVKNKWKELVVTYVRFKTQQKGATGQSANKQFGCNWAHQMQFLDSPLGMREGGTNIFPEGIVRKNLQLNPLPEECLFATAGSQYQLDLELPHGPITKENNTKENITPEKNTPTQSEIRKYKLAYDAVDQSILTNLSEKKSAKTMMDSTDHLFQSYAETFKKFSSRNQIEMKLKLAKLFSEMEMQELEK